MAALNVAISPVEIVAFLATELRLHGLYSTPTL